MIESTRPMLVLVDDNGLTCPKCGSHDIVEVDYCERWNTIHFEDGRLSISQSDPEFETTGLACRSCEGELSAPKGLFDNAEWY